MKTKRKIIFHKTYFSDFYFLQREEVKVKINYILNLIENIGMVPEKFLKHLEGAGGLYEIRISASKNIYRIFCCFDNSNVVVLLNGFQKKSQKTPKKEIELAKRIKSEYFLSKSIKNEKQKSGI